MPLNRNQMAQRIAEEIEKGFIVNLGIGIPTLVSNYIPEEKEVLLHSENGLLGIGPFPLAKELSPDLINAGKQTVTAVKGASFFSSAESFAMIRGSHIDLSVLGALEVDEEGNLANWMIPGKMVKGMGGAMDLVSGSKKVIVAMEHQNKKAESKLLKKCKLPLTGLKCVHRIVTNLAVIDVTPKGFLLREKAIDVSVEQIKKATSADLEISSRLKNIAV
ncbi:MAG: 3-oxoacid CoA-transferase subunit B [Bdellovibrionales bacterium]|nr:3-oxoacid CoA-transferase subunit B [Bdellovibrionales bacterium]